LQLPLRIEQHGQVLCGWRGFDEASERELVDLVKEPFALDSVVSSKNGSAGSGAMYGNFSDHHRVDSGP